jgi:hypothetical protein
MECEERKRGRKEGKLKLWRLEIGDVGVRRKCGEKHLYL